MSLPNEKRDSIPSAAADPSTTNSSNSSGGQNPKKRFFAGLFDLSWRLAIVLLLPLIAGIWLDSGKKSATFTLIGLVIGVIGAVVVIRNIVNRYSEEVYLDDN